MSLETSPPNPTYRLGDFRFNVASGELHTPEGVVRLAPQPTTALSVLVENAGQLVTRETLRARLWPKGYVEVDLGINHCLRQVRKALGDDAQDPRFIETLPRRGYRFIADVEVEPLEEFTPAMPQRLPPRSFTAGWLGPAVLIVVLSGILAGVALITQNRAAPMLVVLPFVPLEPGNPPTAIGVEMQELTTEALVGQAGAALRIRGPASNDFDSPVSPMDGSDVAWASKLGAQYVVSGTIEEESGRSSVFAQLVRTSDGAHLWTLTTETSSDSLGVVADHAGQEVLRFLRRR